MPNAVGLLRRPGRPPRRGHAHLALVPVAGQVRDVPFKELPAWCCTAIIVTMLAREFPVASKHAAARGIVMSGICVRACDRGGSTTDGRRLSTLRGTGAGIRSIRIVLRYVCNLAPFRGVLDNWRGMARDGMLESGPIARNMVVEPPIYSASSARRFVVDTGGATDSALYLVLGQDQTLNELRCEHRINALPRARLLADGRRAAVCWPPAARHPPPAAARRSPT